MTDSITSVPEAVAALGALPVPAGDQPQPLDDRGQPRTMLDRARAALNARMTKDDLRLVLENVISYAADLEAEREKLVRWHREDGEAMAKQRAHIAELQENLRAVNAGWSVARARVAELERPAIKARRNEIRSSYAETITMAREDRDFEGAFNLECQLRDREEQWKREDEAATS
ncbi:hypothetical protein [Streptomyces sp. JB150]|uniref:hypothetical protein n=1 Tax=Streptomyces sp. JB150 TaxID=2714844 RepID=UPI00140AFF32|nr:hypothetical protein [Streptomyces sp. JB150]QIJ61459.1 hypothetical protein G7Z13_04960 [Streptomyces sp. JB150]